MEAVRIASAAPDDNRAAKLDPTFGASIARDCAVVGSAAAWAGSDGPLVGGMVSSVAQNMQCRQFSQKQLMFWKVTVETYQRFRPQNKSPKHAAWF